MLLASTKTRLQFLIQSSPRHLVAIHHTADLSPSLVCITLAASIWTLQFGSRSEKSIISRKRITRHLAATGSLSLLTMREDASTREPQSRIIKLPICAQTVNVSLPERYATSCRSLRLRTLFGSSLHPDVRYAGVGTISLHSRQCPVVNGIARMKRCGIEPMEMTNFCVGTIYERKLVATELGIDFETTNNL